MPADGEKIWDDTKWLEEEVAFFPFVVLKRRLIAEIIHIIFNEGYDKHYHPECREYGNRLMKLSRQLEDHFKLCCRCRTHKDNCSTSC